MTTWTKVDGEWCVRIVENDYPERVVGTVRVVRSKSGRKTRVLIGEHVKHWLGPRGVHVNVYRATEHSPVTKES